MINKNIPINYKQQNGFMALFVGIMLLIGISLMVIFTSNAVVMEQNIGANQVREKQAYENAKLGLEFFTAFINDRDSNDFYAKLVDGVALDVFVENDANDDGNADSDINGDGNTDNQDLFYTNDSTPVKISTVFTAAVSVLTNIAPPDVSVTKNGNFLTISSIGTSDDGTGSRTLSKKMIMIDVLEGNIEHPMIGHGNLSITGTGHVQNLYTNVNIWSGSVVKHSGTAESYISTEDTKIFTGGNGAGIQASGISVVEDDEVYTNTPPNYVRIEPNHGKTEIDGKYYRQQASDGSKTGVDIISGDLALAALKVASDYPGGVYPDCDDDAYKDDETFFRNFFNTCHKTIKASADHIIPDGENDLVSYLKPEFPDNADNMPHNTLIWAEGDVRITGGDVLGCYKKADPMYNPSNSSCTEEDTDVGDYDDDVSVDPVILIVEGDMTTGGTVDIYGIVYIIGDLNITGSFNVFGSVILEGAVTGAGTFDVSYYPPAVKGGDDGWKPIVSTVANSQKDY